MIQLMKSSDLDAAAGNGNSRRMRKLIFVISGVVGLLVFGLIIYVGFTVIRGIKPPVDLATRPWVEHKFYADRLVIDVPWELTPKSSSHGVASYDGRLVTCLRDGVEVVIDVSPASAAGNLDAAMDFMIKSLKEKHATTILAETRKEESILGGRAIALYLCVRDKLWRKTDVRILFFELHDRLYQVHCNSLVGNPAGEKIWERMKKSIRLGNATGQSAETTRSNRSFGLPIGMESRRLSE